MKIRPMNDNVLVLLSKYAGTEIRINGVEHIFMKETDILAIFK